MCDNELLLYFAHVPSSVPYPASGSTTTVSGLRSQHELAAVSVFTRKAECVTQIIRNWLLKHQRQKHQPRAKFSRTNRRMLGSIECGGEPSGVGITWGWGERFRSTTSGQLLPVNRFRHSEDPETPL